MSPTLARRHHYLPRFLLNRFADGDERIAVRMRDRGYFVTSTRNAAVETDLYSRTSPTGGRDSSLEELLAALEGEAAPLLAALAEGRIPEPQSEDREILAHFFAFQAARAPEHFERWSLLDRVIAFADGLDITEDLVAEFLTTEHLGDTRLAHREVEAVTVFVQGALNMPGGPVDRDGYLEAMVFNAITEMAPRIENRAWRVERCRKPRLAISDRGATLKARKQGPWNQGLGVESADEIWVPLDPKSLFVAAKSGVDCIDEVEPKVFDRATQYVAAQAHHALFGHPKRPKVLRQVAMARRRPVLRFQMATIRTSDGKTHEMIHNWVPPDDRPVSPEQGHFLYTGPSFTGEG